MANYCTVKMPKAWTDAGGTYAQWSGGGGLTFGGVSNPTQFRGSAITSPEGFYFDADRFGVVCTSFPDASGNPDPLISQAGAIQALQAALVGVQGQITAMAPWVGENAESAQAERIQDMSDMWALFFGAAILIACWKGIQRLFDNGPHD